MALFINRKTEAVQHSALCKVIFICDTFSTKILIGFLRECDG